MTRFSYQRALSLTRQEPARRFLEQRLKELAVWTATNGWKPEGRFSVRE